MKGRQIVFVALLTIGVTFGLVNEASALPTFARKYRTSCPTCHNGFFKLNSFGEAFRQNGYLVPGRQGGKITDAVLVKEEPVSLGAEAWKEVFPNAVWPGAIPSSVPVSFYAHQRIFFDENKDPSVNFKFPHEFKIFTGGVLGGAFSFWAEHDLQSSGLKRIFVRFNDVFSKGAWGKFGFLPEDALNVRVGRLDVGTLLIPLNVRRTINKPAPYIYEVGTGNTAWDYSDLQSGFEINGILGHRLQYVAGIVNGLTGTGTPAGVEDNNDEKDLYYRVAYKFGGLSPDGQLGAGTEESLQETDNWAEKSFSLGQFGYFGTTTVSAGVENPFYRLGGDARIRLGRLDFYGGVVVGQDDRPTTAEAVRDVATNSWFIEADFVVFPWLQAALGYEEVNYGDTLRLGNSAKTDFSAITTGLTAWPRANIKAAVEGRFLPQDLDGNSQLLVDLTYAF